MSLPSHFQARVLLPVFAYCISLAGICQAQTTPPDLTQPGVIASIDSSSSYNLGPTGLRGWIHCDASNDAGDTGILNASSRQILVTHASTPGNAVVAVNDVILGAIAANSGVVPSFNYDARKAFGAAIAEAEKTGAGTLRIKRWRAGSTTDVNVTIPTLGQYSATAPYACPKSAQILANARNHMVGQLLADANYLNSGGHDGAINALALMASVQPADPNSSTVQTRLQTYARSISIPAFTWAQDRETWIWGPAYQLVFLSEYYLLTNDPQVVPTINGITLWLVEFQSMFGTFGHGPGGLLQDASGRRFASGYGPVNAVGNIANLAIVLGKKALQAASQPIDPKIDGAIQRASGFLGSYVNKGGIPYGEHAPTPAHGNNGKDASAAVFFGLQNNTTVETEFFSRMSTAGLTGVDAGHTGQYLGNFWSALGAGMGGEAAASEHFKQLAWRFDLSRRTNGSFSYDNSTGDAFYSGGATADGTYLGNTGPDGVKDTAINLMTYSLPLKRLFITGRQANPAYTLDSTKVANAGSAGSFRINCTGLSIPQLFTALGDDDPVVRYYASATLASKSLSSADLTNLRSLLASPDSNLRQSAAETLGIRKDTTALPNLVGMLHGTNRDPDHWVRKKVADAIYGYDPGILSVHRDTLLSAFIASAPADPDVIDWSDPLQFSISALSDVLFRRLAAYTINAPKESHLYPALRAGLLLPTGYYRGPVVAFAKTRLNLTDLQNLFPELVEVASADTPADRMFSGGTRADALAFMVENKISEGVEIAFAMLNETVAWGAGTYYVVALNALVSYGDAARYTLPGLRQIQTVWNTRLWDGGLPHGQLQDTITFLENVTSDPPATNLGKCVANSQIVTTTGAQAITLTGASPRGAVSFQKLTDPANGTLTGAAPNFTYTPNGGFTGTDKFTFQTTDFLTTSDPATIAIIVGSPGTGIAAAYFDNANFTSPVLTRTDPQINFDWGTGSPDPSIGADTFSTRWSGFLLAPETGTYSLSSLTSDGIRAYLNGVPVINNFNEQSTRWTDGQSISLTAGQKVPLMVEYFENTGSAVAKLKWTGPSFAGLNGSIIPQAYLFESNSTGGTDITAPVISTLSPADNATGVAHAADLVATFSENIVRGTGNITIKNLSDKTQTVIPITDTTQVAIAGATLIINPTALLLGGKNHAIRIDATAIDDTAGNSFAGIANDTTWNFTTTAPDTTKPTPNPMSFAVPPLTGGSTSITMTATTASDASGVEYRFNNITLGTSSPWQNSPVLTASGLAPSTDYTFTVQARDKSAAGNTTTASAPASARTLGSGPLDLMSLNFYEYGSFSQDAVTLEAGESAGIGALHVSGWQNYKIPWGLDSPAAPITLTSNIGSTATMRLNDVRNGGTHSEIPHPLFAGGDGDLMNAICHGTEDPYDQSALFNMDVSNIPYQRYDLIVYMGANSAYGGDRTGKIVLNGGAEQGFTLTLGFSGFTEITNATTPGNYIVFRGLTNPSLNLKVWGNGYNHLGPCGFQIVNYSATPVDTSPPTISSLAPTDNAISLAASANLVATFSEIIAIGTGNITVKNLTDGTQTIIAVTDATQVSISGNVLTINPAANLVAGKNYAVQIAGNAIVDRTGNGFAGISNDTAWNFMVQIPPVVNAGVDQTVTLVTNATSWTPSAISTTAWFDASDATSITALSGAVSQWADKSGNNRHVTQITSTAKPAYVTNTINGLPVLRFDGGDSLTKTLSALSLSGIQCAFVAKQTSGGPAYSGVAKFNGPTDQFNIRESNASPNLQTDFNTGAGSAYSTCGTSYTYGSPFMGGLSYNGSNVIVYANGVAGNAADASGTMDITLMNVGGQGGFVGDIGEMVFVHSNDPGIREKLEGYLAHKWGLAANLPADHPYKSAAPPTVSAVANLDATVSDGNGDPLSTTWSNISGPAAATFGASSAVDTSATFPHTGTYTLRLTANDGYGPVTDDVVITVNSVTNTAPTIFNIANTSTNVNTPTSAIAFTIGDTETAVGSLTVTGTSSNTTLVPNANIVFGGSGANRTMTITPAVNQTGISTISVTVSDGTLTATDTFELSVIAPNTSPLVNAGPDQTVLLSGSTPWTPAQISCAAWYDAADTNTITVSSGVVSQWRDKSGNSLHLGQGTAANQPATGAIINGRNALDFTGDFMTTASNPFGASVNNAFVIAVHKIDAVTDGTLFSLTGSENAANRWQSHAPYSGTMYFDCGASAGTNRISTSYGVSAGSVVLASFYCSKTENVQQVYKNGSLLISDSSGHAVSTAGNISVGGIGTSYQDTSIGEFIIINGSVSAADRQKLEGYLAHKWGQTASLPADHPYKSAAPGAAIATANLNGTVSDAEGDSLTEWTIVSTVPTGLPVTLGNASAVDTTATFTQAGTYTFRLTATDGSGPVSDDVVITVNPASAYETWVTAANLGGGVDATFNGDANGDGMANGLGWLLGATNPNENGNLLMPQAANSGGNLSLSFKMPNSTKRGTAVLSLQYSNDLGGSDPWTNHTIPVPDATDTSSVVDFQITPIPGTDHNQVEVTIPASAAGGTGKVFARMLGVP